jgi:hypothetical protein
MAIEYPLRICPAPGCGKQHRRLLKYCSNHEQRIQRNGHPTEYRVKFEDLDPWRPEVATMLNRWAAHESIVAGLELMHELLHFYGVDSDMAEVGRRARPYLDKVIRAGGTSCGNVTSAVSAGRFDSN